MIDIIEKALESTTGGLFWNMLGGLNVDEEQIEINILEEENEEENN